MHKRLLWLIIGLLSMLLLLSGCAKGTAHVTVNKNGSIDVAVKLRLDASTQALLSGKMEDSLVSKLQAAGIPLQKIQDGKATEYQFLKSYASVEEMKSFSGKWEGVDTKVSTQNRWLYTKYNVEAQPQMNVYMDKAMDNIGTLGIPKSLARLLLKSFAIDFKLTLPVDLFGDNNATVQEGRTLTWHITLADTEPIQMEVYVPNIKNIVIAASVVALILVVLVVLWFRRRKRRTLRKS
ncbi:hypothetical protein H1230_05960 [Paenibacillus sp. 19GGS1-52]|uniref:hypothetical protein n=1 Tax=Paenibacillus sp. 19GGS1-52 TaxID=2758563 RepID=UPI001EFB5E8F|nr:hypothetical protein [Paenibacillus sp. 19GGS1-52]ULO08355.1 hypothetical protein H1230_05960 [Paenibacillus sp. 19GGS1-52]